MIYVYVFALVAGGILLAASLLLGGHGDHQGLDAPASSGDVGGPGEVAPQSGVGDAVGVEGLLVWLFSARFWTFFGAFFGLTGLLLDGFGLVPNPWIAGVAAIAMGLFAGVFSSWLVRVMRAEASNSATSSSEYIGKTGRLLVACGAGSVGKVRLEIRGTNVDLLCTAMDEGPYEARDEVIVVEMDGTRARVAKTQVSMR